MTLLARLGHRRIPVLALAAIALVAAATPARAAATAAQLGAEMIERRDHLGFRVLYQKVQARKPSPELRLLLLENADRVGYDLLFPQPATAGAPASNMPSGGNALDHQLAEADQLMLSGRFEDAFGRYQTVAKALKARGAGPGRNASERIARLEAETLRPFVLESMGRALYGAGRFGEALVVFSWIPRSYPRFRQVLFERMWSSFRMGRVDMALGAIASQRSAYFSKFMHPESYLLNAYLYRKLCRPIEILGWLAEMKALNESLEKEDVETWAAGEPETRILWKVATDRAPEGTVNMVTAAERQAERQRVRANLTASFRRVKPALIKSLRAAQAYLALSDGSDARGWLKPVESFPGRADFLKRDLEFWPADSAEEWIDEIGTHRFLGESLCDVKR